MTMSQHATDTLASSVDIQIEELAASVDLLVRQQREMLDSQQRLAEVWREAAPILKSMTAVATANLANLEHRGYFRAGRAALDVVDRVVGAYGEDDLQRFSDAVVSILDTVRNLTQPEVLTIANEAIETLSHADRLPPLGMTGMLRAGRDAEVQQGMAVFMELLRHVGRASTHLARREPAAPAARPAPRPARSAAPPPAPTRARTASSPPSASAAPATAAPEADEVTFMGARFQADGTLLEPEKWTREMAAALAATVGVPEMTTDHWAVIDFARKQYAETKHSPNIRRLTEGSGIDTRRLYALFPQAPGRAVARVAGLPKPAGCI
jgi:TusE/DsrC/DsvC family sulfur relay protein